MGVKSEKCIVDAAHSDHITSPRNMPPRKQTSETPMKLVAGMGEQASAGMAVFGCNKRDVLNKSTGAVLEREQKMVASLQGKSSAPIDFWR